MKSPLTTIKIALVFVLLLGFQSNAQHKKFQDVSPEEISEKQTALISEKLELSEKDSKRLKEINLKYATEMKALRDEGRSRETRQKFEGLNHAQNEEVQKILEKDDFEKYLVLKKKMHERMKMKMNEKQIEAKYKANSKKRERLQERQAFIEKLDLTEDQKGDLKQIGDKYDQQRRELRGEGRSEENRTKMEALIKAQNEEVQKVLNEDQFKLYLEMQKERQQRMKRERGKQRRNNRN